MGGGRGCRCPLDRSAPVAKAITDLCAGLGPCASRTRWAPAPRHKCASPSIMQGGLWSSRADGRPEPMAFLSDTKLGTSSHSSRAEPSASSWGLHGPDNFWRTPDYGAPSAACSPRSSSEKTREREQRLARQAGVQGGLSGLGRVDGEGRVGQAPTKHHSSLLLKGEATAVSEWF